MFDYCNESLKASTYDQAWCQKSEWIGKDFKPKKWAQNTLQCFFCTQSPARFPLIFKDCASREEGKRANSVVQVWWGQRVSMAQHSTCLRAVLVTEEEVQHAVCVALKRSTPITVSSGGSAHFADALKAGALLHPVVNLGNILEHERASPLSNVPLGRVPGTWTRERLSAYRDRAPGVCVLSSALESGVRVVWSGGCGGPDAVVFSPVSPAQAWLRGW